MSHPINPDDATAVTNAAQHATVASEYTMVGGSSYFAAYGGSDNPQVLAATQSLVSGVKQVALQSAIGAGSVAVASLTMLGHFDPVAIMTGGIAGVIGSVSKGSGGKSPK